MSSSRSLLPWFLVPALPLLAPLVAMRFTPEVDWSVFDFTVAYVLLAGTGLTYRLITSRATSVIYRAAAALAVLGWLSLVWVNLAAGFIGDEQNPANLLYGGVVAVGLLGMVLSRLRPTGLARTLFATAAVQFLVPFVALFFWSPQSAGAGLEVFILNFCWVLLFVASGLLFARAARPAGGLRT